MCTKCTSTCQCGNDCHAGKDAPKLIPFDAVMYYSNTNKWDVVYSDHRLFTKSGAIFVEFDGSAKSLFLRPKKEKITKTFYINVYKNQPYTMTHYKTKQQAIMVGKEIDDYLETRQIDYTYEV